MTINLRVDGINTVLKNLKTVRKEQAKQLTKGLKKAGALLKKESKKIVPVDTGALRRSAFSRVRWANTVRAEAVVGYLKEYAAIQHEVLWFRHKPGKSAKFLEIPLRRNAKLFKDIIATELATMSRRSLKKFGPSLK